MSLDPREVQAVWQAYSDGLRGLFNDMHLRHIKEMEPARRAELVKEEISILRSAKDDALKALES